MFDSAITDLVEIWGGVAGFVVDGAILIITAPAWYADDIRRFTREGGRWRARFPVDVEVRSA